MTRRKGTELGLSLGTHGSWSLPCAAQCAFASPEGEISTPVTVAEMRGQREDVSPACAEPKFELFFFLGVIAPAPKSRDGPQAAHGVRDLGQPVAFCFSRNSWTSSGAAARRDFFSTSDRPHGSAFGPAVQSR